MKVILTSIGTRGDMEPFIAIAEILKEKGESVICLFPEQFRKMVEEKGIAFESLGSEFIEMIESELGKTALGSNSQIKKIIAYIRLGFKQTGVNKEMILKQHEVIERIDPDRIVHNGKVIYPVIWGLKNKNKTTLVSPVPYLHYVKNHSHLAFNSDFGTFFNKLSYSLANYGLVKTIMASVKWLKLKKEVNQKQIQNALFTNDTIYTISPSLFERPDYWDQRIKVLGFHQQKTKAEWKEDDQLLSFINDHDKILFITFGSMTNLEPEKKTAIIIEILEKNKIPAIINTASGGLVIPEKYNKGHIFFVESIPYEFIFPKVYAVMHHGGSGTTHMALKYGCASLIIPHIIDQFCWNKIMHEKGTGPLGISIRKISTKKLEPIIKDLMNDSSYKISAKSIADQMDKENFRSEIYKTVMKIKE